ncbi:MAG TPA: DHH family phosphoesterase [Methanomassiliicoccales archaeon]|nr:DHH family phosphoesterase [Methanomassiliicoccales archaeon]
MSPGHEHPDVAGFESAARHAANGLLSAKSATVIAHIDADGVSAASIARRALERASIEPTVRFVKKLDEDEVRRANSALTDAIWLVDLGSSFFSKLEHPIVCVTDHHIPEAPKAARRSGQNDLSVFVDEGLHVNPHLFGIDGSTDISGAGTTYSVAKYLARDSIDLLPLAIVGAVGDLQDSSHCRLKGINRTFVENGSEAGVLLATRDIRIFGRETRPVARMLQYSTDPMLPGLTNCEDGCNAFLLELGIDLKEGEKWRCWVDLSHEEKRTVCSALSELLLDNGMGAGSVRRLIGDVYILRKEAPGTELHDAKEYSTLLNACGRYMKAEIGLDICLGDRGDSYAAGKTLLANHRGNLAEAIALVRDLGVQRREHLQWFHGRDEILDSIVGIVAGMVLGSGEVVADVPIIAFAYSEDEKVKVSARGTRAMVDSGLDLASAIKHASEKVGGTGGGHNIAAGATIGMGKEEEFLDEIEAIIARQMSPSV